MSVKESVRDFLRTNPVYLGTLPDNDLADHYPFIDSGILDSIGLFTLVVHLERTFSIKVDVTDLVESNFSDLNKIQLFVERKATTL